MTTITRQEIEDSCAILYRHFGAFECGDGWLPMIHKLSLRLEQIITEEMKTATEDQELPYILQIKEKFGGLRFYISSGTDQMIKLIDKAEEDSFDICENCGSTDNVKTEGKGWIKTLCNGCTK